METFTLLEKLKEVIKSDFRGKLNLGNSLFLSVALRLNTCGSRGLKTSQGLSDCQTSAGTLTICHLLLWSARSVRDIQAINLACYLSDPYPMQVG